MPGELLCETCRSDLPFIDMRYACPRCGAPFGWLVCTECAPCSASGRLNADDFAFSAARACCSYEGVAKRLITTYKDRGEARLDATLAHLLCDCVRGTVLLSHPAPAGLIAARKPVDTSDWAAWADALVTIPANPDNLRRRGYDHMGRIAALSAAKLSLPLLPALTTARAADQRALSGKQRAANRSGSFALAPDAAPLPPRILLVDDVFTTGATLNAAARTLLDGGAKEVRAATIARVW